MTANQYTIQVGPDYPVPEFGVRPIQSGCWRNGMAVRMPNWLGDAIMALPALRQLKLILPENCALMVICPAGMRQFYYSIPWVDVIMPLEKLHSNWSSGEIRMLRKFNPGVGVLFNNSLRDVMMMRLARVSQLYGAVARGRTLFLKRGFQFPGRNRGALNHLHHVARYLAISYALGAPKWDGAIPEIEIARNFFQLRGNLRALCEHRKLLVLAAGAAYGAAKRWNSENFRAVAKRWIDSGGIAVAVGGPLESLIGQEIGSGLPTDKYYNLMGKTDLYDLMHLISNATLLANDSGVMHLGALFNRPGVAVFGSTDYTATGPAFGDWKVLYSGRTCAPCFRRVCPHHTRACMQDVTPEMAWEALEALTPGLESAVRPTAEEADLRPRPLDAPELSLKTRLIVDQ